MKSVFISAKDYDKIKKGEEIENVVEAKNRPPMRIWANSDPVCSSTPTELTGYENAIFNGERN